MRAIDDYRFLIKEINRIEVKLNTFFRNTKPVGRLLGLLLFLLAGFFAATALMLVFPQTFGTSGEIRVQMLVQGCSQLLMFLAPALLFAWCFKEESTGYLGFDFHARKWLLGLVGIVVLLLLLPLNDWLSWWNMQWDFGAADAEVRTLSDKAKEITEQMLSLTGTGDFVLQLIVVALIPAICEECFFRGALQQTLGEWFRNKHVAVWVTALIFSVAHGDLLGLVPRFVLGLLLGYLFLSSGSIVVNICAHFFNNALIVTMYHLYHLGSLGFNPGEPMLMPTSIVASCSVGAALLLGLYFVKIPEKWVQKNKR